MQQNTPTLYLFPVTLGTTPPTEVLPQRNIDIVRSIRYFMVENMRSARRFLKACDREIDIDALMMVELNEHTRAEEISAMLQPMSQGNDMGIISEAGCPAIADPGADAVAIAQSRGYRVVPLVGPSSILLSLMASGFNGQSFAFNGYLPIDNAKRMARLREMEKRIRRESQTQIFIETPYRNNKMLQYLCDNMPSDLKLCVAANITCPDEDIRTMSLAQWRNKQYNYDKKPAIFLLYK